MPKFTFTSPDGKSYDVEGPEGATKEQAFAILQKKLKPAAPVVGDGGKDDSYGVMANVAGAAIEPILSMGTGMVAKPLSDIAGLAATGKEIISPTPGGGDPEAFQKHVQESLTYEPKTGAGKFVSEYNPLALAAKGIDWGASKVRGGIESIPVPEALETTRSAYARGTEEAIKQAPGVLGIKGGAALKERIPAKQAALDIQKELNLPKDQLRERVQKAGFVTPPEGTSWLAGIPGAQKLFRYLANGANEKAKQHIAEKTFNLKPGTPLTKETLENIIHEHGQKYQDVVDAAYGPEISVPRPPKISPILSESGKPFETPRPDIKRKQGLLLSKEFRSKLQNDLSELKKKTDEAPETFKTLSGSEKLLREWLGKEEADPRVAMDAIKQLRKDANTGFRSDDPSRVADAFTRKEIANNLEDAFEDHLAKSGRNGLVKDFKEARKTIKQAYDVMSVVDDVGNVDMIKLYNLSKRQPLSGALKTVAEYAGQYPKAAGKATGMVAAISPFDWMFGLGAMAAGHPWVAAAEIASKVAVPAAAQAGLLQKRTPTYKVGEFAPAFATGAGIGIQAQE